MLCIGGVQHLQIFVSSGTAVSGALERQVGSGTAVSENRTWALESRFSGPLGVKVAEDWLWDRFEFDSGSVFGTFDNFGSCNVSRSFVNPKPSVEFFGLDICVYVYVPACM